MSTEKRNKLAAQYSNQNTEGTSIAALMFKGFCDGWDACSDDMKIQLDSAIEGMREYAKRLADAEFEIRSLKHERTAYRTFEAIAGDCKEKADLQDQIDLLEKAAIEAANRYEYVGNQFIGPLAEALVKLTVLRQSQK